MTFRPCRRYVLGGNEGDVHSYDPETGTWYAVLLDPRECRSSNTGTLCTPVRGRLSVRSLTRFTITTRVCSALKGIPPVTRIGVIDWTAGALLSASPLTWPKVDGAADRYQLLWQIAQGGSS
eukprot:COSAG02_NODE_1084_length_14692_cov_214.338724_10_plen_122_part_00